MPTTDSQPTKSNVSQPQKYTPGLYKINVEDAKIRAILVALKPQLSHEYEQHMAWRMRWFFARFFVCIYVFSAIGGVVGFLLVRNPYCLALIAAPNVLLPAIYYLVPMHERMYGLRALKIQTKAQMKFRGK
jgi:hypothetical protein